MNTIRTTLGAVAVAMSFAAPGIASAKGCLKGAAVGGVAGHVAGHHGLIGAAAGCAIEHHREKVRDRDAMRRDAPVRDNRVTEPDVRTRDQSVDAPR